MRFRALALTGSALALLAPATALAAWSGATTVSARDRASLADADVATDDGRALAAWVRTPPGARPGTGRVQVASRPGPSARWTPPVTLSGAGARAPRTAVNARGDAAVAWARGRVVMAAVRSGPAGRWSVARAARAGADLAGLRLTLGRSGRPTLMWSERRGERFTVRVAARASSRAGWRVRPPSIETPGPSAPALALAAGPGALVAWVEGGRARVARTVDGAFERPVALSSDATGPPAAALSPGGEVLAAWSGQLPGGTSVVLSTDRPRRTGAWGGSHDIGIGSAPVAAVNDRGDAVVAWRLARAGEPQGIQAATRRGRGAWRASTVVAGEQCDCEMTVGDVAIDGRGTALVGWRRDDDDGAARGRAVALAPGARAWRAAPGRAASTPSVAAGRGAGGMAAWVQAGAGVRVATVR